MTPAARLQAAIDILTALETTDQPTDRLLREFFRARRYAGSKDRAAIGQRVFEIQRQRAALAWRIGSDTPRALALASVLEAGEEPQALFTGGGYGPAELSDDEKAAMAATPGAPPLHVQGAFPAFLESELVRAFGDGLLPQMQALNERAPVDLRVNTLRRARGEVLEALTAQGFAAAATPYAPHGIRIASGEGSAALRTSAMFESGAYEFQDEAAQIAAVLCAARPGQRVLDLAAGAGGKSLALAAAMRNEGEIAACDIRQPALQELAVRAKRAGATNIRTFLIDPALPEGPFDIVLVDAPCSGTGTWRRQPELRWKLTPQILAARMAVQDKLLDDAAGLVKPGGRLVYATCSILPCENEDRVAALLARDGRFKTVRADSAWRDGGEKAPPPPGMAESFTASPLKTGTDGFFVAVLER